jgi:redox-sensitive bicupin YhaK (pirin superfamily)
MTPPNNTNHPPLVFRPAHERFRSALDWLESWHSFSFAGHHDPNWMGFGPLRVINDDTISAGRGFGMHSHRDMEIITVMIEGELHHQDSAGNHGVIRAGDVQRMSAGTGIMHSEINESEQACRLLQIWIEPSQQGLPPAYEQRKIALTKQQWIPVLDPNDHTAMAVARPIQLWRLQLAQGESIQLPGLGSPMAWIQILNGDISISSETKASPSELHRGDGLGFRPNQTRFSRIQSLSNQTDLLLFGLS